MILHGPSVIPSLIVILEIRPWSTKWISFRQWKEGKKSLDTVTLEDYWWHNPFRPQSELVTGGFFGRVYLQTPITWPIGSHTRPLRTTVNSYRVEGVFGVRNSYLSRVLLSPSKSSRPVWERVDTPGLVQGWMDSRSKYNLLYYVRLTGHDTDRVSVRGIPFDRIKSEYVLK